MKRNTKSDRTHGGLLRPPGMFVLSQVIWLCLVGLARAEANESTSRPDVLFIVVDDLNDWNSLLDPTSPIQTPNLQQLAARGTLFTRAYCISAACNPSRAATLTGLRPATTGVYGNKSDWRAAMPNRPTIMQRFRNAGYDVRGAGKIFHHHLNGAFHDADSFDDFQHMPPQKYPPSKLNRGEKYGSRNTDWGAWPPNPEDSIDFATTNYCVEQLKNRPRASAGNVDASKRKPLFLACGIFKPHSPFFAPLAFHQSYQDISMPARKADDWDDLPAGAASLMRNKKWFWRGMMQLQSTNKTAYADFIRSYAACASFADAQIGRVLEALHASGREQNTIVVLWSDHGFHLGEKDHIEKFALWEKSNHVPFIVVAPHVGSPGTRCDQPVDLSVVYPTLLELAGLPADDECDGHSVVPLLKSPDAAWEHPAVMTYQKGNHAVRSQRWRYIRYADGSEELYDHDADPMEWTNLAGEETLQQIMAEHRKWLPSAEADPIGDLRAPRRSP